MEPNFSMMIRQLALSGTIRITIVILHYEEVYTYETDTHLMVNMFEIHETCHIEFIRYNHRLD